MAHRLKTWLVLAAVLFGLVAPSLELADARATTTLVSRRSEAHTTSGRCSATVLYPQIQGAPTPANERINKFLELRFRGIGDRELKKSTKDCNERYLVSIGFDARVVPGPLLSVRRTKTILRGALMYESTEATCDVFDMRTGKRVDPLARLDVKKRAAFDLALQKGLEQRFKTRDLGLAGIFGYRSRAQVCMRPDGYLVLVPRHRSGDTIERDVVELLVTDQDLQSL